jgi:hypothetical protein
MRAKSKSSAATTTTKSSAATNPDSLLDRALRLGNTLGEVMMNRDGKISATILAVSGEQIFGVWGDLESEIAKDNFLRVARMMGIAYGADALVTIVEAWTDIPSKLIESAPLLTAQSLEPNECVSILAQTMGETRHDRLMIRRDWNGRFLCLDRCLIPNDAPVFGPFSQIMYGRVPNEAERKNAMNLLKEMGMEAVLLPFPLSIAAQNPN